MEKPKRLSVCLMRYWLHDVLLDDGVIVGVLTSCRHGGLVDRGLEYFNEVVRNRGVVPNQQMYGCLVDLLGRTGRVDESYAMGLTFNTDEVIWSSLLASCRMHEQFLRRRYWISILELTLLLAALSTADGNWDDSPESGR
ncbi:hypothetical protein ZOSMA_322G00040 [Zostera marina]|uniref:Pentatricopeptide repeat-containing protein n=1 Tax=Zostera marina TaxID=29655 RepID=A0A0K9P8L6_ZOSMR|nr:hypothetical protein ZOSMA_322G00040 [Zostera marina]